MELAFRERPYDLLVVVVMCLAFLPFAIAGTGGAARLILASALVMLLPGYAISAGLFPAARDMDWVRRVAVSVGLSIASVALLGLLLSATPPGVRVETLVPSLLGLTIGACAIAYLRRIRLPAAERLGLSVTVTPPRWRELPRSDKVIAVVVVVALVSGVGALAYAAANPPPREPFTELYLLDSQGGLLGEIALSVGEGASVVIGVANHESRTVDYTVEVRLVTLRLVYNETTGRNDTFEEGSTTLDTFPITLADGGRSESPFPFSVGSSGEYRLRCLLYIGPAQGPAYRTVDARVHVT